jgi:hypothetical protein
VRVLQVVDREHQAPARVPHGGDERAQLLRGAALEAEVHVQDIEVRGGGGDPAGVEGRRGVPPVSRPDELDAWDPVVQHGVHVAVVGGHRQHAHRADHGRKYAGSVRPAARRAGNVDSAGLPPYVRRMARPLLAPPLRGRLVDVPVALPEEQP